MDPAVIGTFIPIVALIGALVFGLTWVRSDHRRKAQILEQNHKERMHALEKGSEPPPIPSNLVSSGNGPATASAAKSLRSGIMLTLIGILVFLGIYQASGGEGALFGLIPAAIGIANLVYAAVLWQKEKAGGAAAN